MARSEKATAPKSVGQTVFTYASPEAQSIFLAGTFNGWDTGSTPMTRQEDGTWRTALELAPGQYEYKFVVDGVWCCDPASERCVPNPFGTMNCTIEVGEKAEPQANTATAR